MHVCRVDEISGFVGTGICVPLFAKIGDTNVVVKTYNNIESNRVLANELICFQIAKKLNLPIPEAGICIIDKETLVPADISFDEKYYGIGFYSTRINKVTRGVITPKLIQDFISNKSDLAKIILFDHLIYNKDRHASNILIDLSQEKKINIIDHSHAFNLGPIWDCYQLQRLMNEEDYKSEEILKNNEFVYRVFFESMNISKEMLLANAYDFKQILSDGFFHSIISELPDEWGINSNDRGKLIEYLGYRLSYIDIICHIIANHNY